MSTELDLFAPVEEQLTEVTQVTELQARHLTELIRVSASTTYLLVAKAHQCQAHKALGYSTWEDYVKTEFNMSASRSYQLINLSNTVDQLTAVLPDGVKVELNEKQARDIKGALPAIVEQLSNEDFTDTEEATTRANELIEEAREQAKLEKAKIQEREKQLEEAKLREQQKALEDEATALLSDTGDNERAKVERPGQDSGEAGWDKRPGYYEEPLNEAKVLKEAADATLVYKLFDGLLSLSTVFNEGGVERVKQVIPEGRRQECASLLDEVVPLLEALRDEL